MKKKLFDFKMFREAFRQTGWQGILFLALILLPSLISLLAPPLNRHFYQQPEILSPAELQVSLLIIFIFAAPFLTLRAFRYTTERKGSDFYHALPHTRSCVFFTHLCAVFSWLFIIALASGLICSFTAGLFPYYYRISFPDVLIYNFSMLLLAFYVAAVTACGIHLSGTTGSNFLVSLLILIGPRLILYTLVHAVVEASPVLPRNHLPLPYGINLFSNMVYAFFTKGFEGLMNNLSLYDPIHLLYTFCAVILWILLGAHLASKRKSERAEAAVGNPRVRACIRIGLAFLLCLAPITQILRGSFSPFDILVFYLLAILAFFGYELIATRSIKALGKAVPSLLILFALNLGAFFICRSTMRAANHYQPEAEKISHVRIISNKYQPSHLDLAIENSRIENKEVHQLVAKLLQKTLEMDRRQDKYYRDYHERDSITWTVAIKSGLLERYRRLRISPEDLTAISQALSQDQSFVNAYMELPDEKLPGSHLSAPLQWHNSFNDSDMELAAERLYRCLKEEVKEIGFAAWYQHQNSSHFQEDQGYLSLQTKHRGIYGYSEFIINKDLPKTLALYRAEEERLNTLAREKVLSCLKSWAEAPVAGSSFAIHLSFDQSRWTSFFEVIPSSATYRDEQFGIDEKQLAELTNALAQMNGPSNASEAAVSVTIDILARHYQDIVNVSAFFTGEEVPPLIKELMQKATGAKVIDQPVE